jgi:hypothetical protein
MRTATARPESTFRPRNRPVSKAVVYQKINVNFPVNGPHNILGKIGKNHFAPQAVVANAGDKK